MKNCSLFILVSVLTAGAFAQTPAHSQPQTQPGTSTVIAVSEAKDLATGYAFAFTQLSRPPLTLAFQKEGTMRVLEDVKGVRAAEGVLVVEVGRGLIYVINPKDVVYLTDGPQVTTRAAAK